jgi:D-aminoacyl-tRNA deacylase
MIGLLQRVSRASVEVDGAVVGRIGAGLLVLLAVEPDDSEADADSLVDRLLRYRVFPDDAGRMNLSLTDSGGSVLLVPQFTLAADTRRGLRPGFSTAAAPGHGEALFDRATAAARRLLGEARVATGKFGAHMQVSLTNDGPVTFLLRQPARRAAD